MIKHIEQHKFQLGCIKKLQNHTIVVNMYMYAILTLGFACFKLFHIRPQLRILRRQLSDLGIQLSNL